MLRVSGIDVFYGDLQALREVFIEVREEEFVSIIGANGAGKTTTLLTISGLLRPQRGEITFNGSPIHRLPSSKIVEMGIGHVPEGRQLFPSLTVKENLEMGALFPRAKRVRSKTMEWVFQLFPRLKERENQHAGTLSGGEQQMLAIGRGLMSTPRLLMLDEPSLGLAPLLVTTIFETVKEINSQGTMILLVEQNVFHALKLSHRAYVFENGRILMHGRGEDLLQDEHIKKAYLGI